MIVFASSHIEAANGLLDKIKDIILYPLMTLLGSIALLVFMWGLFQYVVNAESEDGRSTGKRHMMYGIIGLTIMFSALAILRIAAMTIGCDIDTPGGCT